MKELQEKSSTKASPYPSRPLKHNLCIHPAVPIPFFLHHKHHVPKYCRFISFYCDILPLSASNLINLYRQKLPANSVKSESLWLSIIANCQWNIKARNLKSSTTFFFSFQPHWVYCNQLRSSYLNCSYESSFLQLYRVIFWCPCFKKKANIDKFM